MKALARRAASSGSTPRASQAAIAAEKTQPLPCVLVVAMRSALEEDVGYVVGVAALDHGRARAQRDQLAGGRPPVVEASDLAPEKHLRLGDVGGDDSGQRDQLPAQRVDCVVAQQPRAPLGDHHRVDDKPGEVMVCHGLGDGGDDRRAGQHAGLRRLDSDVLDDDGDLLPNQGGRQLEDLGHADRVLRGDRGDRRRAMHAKGGESLQVGLDAGPAARIGSSDRQGNRELHAGRHRSPAQ